MFHDNEGNTDFALDPIRLDVSCTVRAGIAGLVVVLPDASCSIILTHLLPFKIVWLRCSSICSSCDVVTDDNSTIEIMGGFCNYSS